MEKTVLVFQASLAMSVDSFLSEIIRIFAIEFGGSSIFSRYEILKKVIFDK